MAASLNDGERRVCRVQPDVPAIDRAFDYLVPPEAHLAVRVGTIVRVQLHGRRVRGWVVTDDVEPEAGVDHLLPLTKVVSDGPPADVVELCRWAAWRYAGPLAVLLRAASPPNVVAPSEGREVEAAVFPPDVLPDIVATARQRPRAVVAWPPCTDRRELVLGLLAAEGSTIVVVPDAARVAVLARQLEREGRHAVVLRSDLSDAERTRAWDRTRAGACVVVGGRLAVLAPVPDLEAVVLLDEGDEALQEERAPTWHARELAFERARRSEVRITLVSPTPTVDAEAQAGVALRATRLVERAGWPRLETVDPRDEPPGRGLLTTPLASVLHEVVGKGGRAVCVLNRKGRARLLVCDACGQLARCEQCGAAVAEFGEELRCPRCGTTRPRVCLHCHHTRFRARRPGVTRVAEEIAALVKRARVTEVAGPTSDPIPDETDIVVGTEAVLHRLRSARPVLLCAFLEFDQELLAPRYRAVEQALWLLVRAARIVGPRAGPGRVLVQTRLADHEVLEVVRRADPALVTRVERARREALGFPPFGGLAEISGDTGAVETAVRIIANAPALRVLGPSGAPQPRALVQAPSVDALCDGLAGVDLSAARAEGRLRVAVDPPRV